MNHDGHRERLKNKFLSAPSSLEDHEILELLFFYAIPRKNTNEIAHNLLNRFGSIKGVFDAGIPATKQIDGVGDGASLYLRVISETIARYEKSEQKNVQRPLESHLALRNYLTSLFVGTENEITYLLLFDAQKVLICCDKISEGYSCGNTVSMRDITLSAIANNAASAILVHNHPNGRTIPSGEDIATTNVVRSVLNSVGINFIDHFIVAGNDCRPILNTSKEHYYTSKK